MEVTMATRHETALRWRPPQLRAKGPDSAFYHGTTHGQRIGKLDDGTTVAVPHLPYEWWIDPHGSVCPVVLHTNRVHWGKRARDYALDTIDRLIKQGWVCYERPPGYDLRGEPTPDEIAAWELERERVIAERRQRARDEIPPGLRALGVREVDELRKLMAETSLSQREFLDEVLGRVMSSPRRGKSREETASALDALTGKADR